MSKYTLKTFYSSKQLEVFESRTPGKLRHLLMDERMNQGGAVDGWGVPLETPNRFELYDSLRRRVFDGTIDEVKQFVSKLR